MTYKCVTNFPQQQQSCWKKMIGLDLEIGFLTLKAQSPKHFFVDQYPGTSSFCLSFASNF